MQKSQAGAPLGLGFAAKLAAGLAIPAAARGVHPPRQRCCSRGTSDASRRRESRGQTAASGQGKFTRLPGLGSRSKVKKKSEQKKLRD